MHPKFEKFIDRYLPKKHPINREVKSVFRKVWKKLRKLPASSSGRYHHPVENYEPYGLVNHIMRTVWFTKELVREEQGTRNVDSKKKYEAIAAAFLHDLGKLKTFAGNHAVYGLPYLKEAKLSSEVKAMVKCHMHYWSPWPASNVYQRIVAYADYFASKKEIEIAGMDYLRPIDKGEEEDE